MPETIGAPVLAGGSGAGRRATSWPTAQTYFCATSALRSPVAPAAARSSSVTSILALGAAAPVAASPRAVVPSGTVIAKRLLCVKTPTTSAPATVVVTEGPMIRAEFLRICPALALTGCAESTPV